MEGLHETTPTPDQCQKQVSESAWKTFDELSNELDRICITFGFTMSKMSGSKDYLYYQCHKGGKERKNNANEKEREKQSKKTGKSVYSLTLTLFSRMRMQTFF